MEDGKIPGALHLYGGQEAVASGVMQHLADDDYITSAHRGHGHLSLKAIFSKCSPSCLVRPRVTARKGGSMHISNMALGMLGANGIVGGGPPVAMGAAFSIGSEDKASISGVFGDGASNEGSFHEAANMAALTNSPLVCLRTTVTESTLLRRIIRRLSTSPTAQRYGMPGVVVDGWT